MTPDRIVDRHERRRFLPIGDTLWDAHEYAGHLPRRVNFGPRRVGWFESELLAVVAKIKAGWKLPPLPRKSAAGAEAA